MTSPNPAPVVPTTEQVTTAILGRTATAAAAAVQALYAPLLVEREALLDENAGLREVIRTAESSLILLSGEQDKAEALQPPQPDGQDWRWYDGTEGMR